MRTTTPVFLLLLALASGILFLRVEPPRPDQVHGRDAWQWIRYAADSRDIHGGETDRARGSLQTLDKHALAAFADAYLGTFPKTRVARWRESVTRVFPSLGAAIDPMEDESARLRATARDLLDTMPPAFRLDLARAILPRLHTNLNQLRAPNVGDHPLDVIIQDLGRAHPELATPALCRLALDPRMDVSALALSLLPDFADHFSDHAAEFITLVQSDDPRSADSRAFAVRQLPTLGAAARAAIPTLESMLASREFGALAAVALWKIDRATNAVLPVLAGAAGETCCDVQATLAEMGEAARPALPRLVGTLDQADLRLRVRNIEVILGMAPEWRSQACQALADVLGTIARQDNTPYHETGARAASLLEREKATDARSLTALAAGANASSPALRRSSRHALETLGQTVPPRRPTLQSWFGKAPSIDGTLSPGEWSDATEIRGSLQWIPEFSPVTSVQDLNVVRGYVKHDDAWLYFAFQVHDDVLYGIDTPRWLPRENPRAHELSRDGFPWFGDEMEILLNASNTWRGDESANGDGSSWQMVCNVTKSRLGGIGTGGLLEGEPRSDPAAWNTYNNWILQGAQKAAVRVLSGRQKGYVIEWAVRFNPCVELKPGLFYTPDLGTVSVGLNIAVGDLDTPEKGAGNFGGFHHEQWWAGAPHTRTQKDNFGTLQLMGRQRRGQASR